MPLMIINCNGQSAGGGKVEWVGDGNYEAMKHNSLPGRKKSKKSQHCFSPKKIPTCQGSLISSASSKAAPPPTPPPCIFKGKSRPGCSSNSLEAAATLACMWRKKGGNCPKRKVDTHNKGCVQCMSRFLLNWTYATA